MLKLLITGAEGQLGRALKERLVPSYDVIALNRQQCDLSQSQALTKTLESYQPDVIINTAAYTAVDRAESEAALAFQVNAEAPREIARYCEAHQCALIHYSTDYVFDGQKNTPYTEEDPTAPLNVYGQSKRFGELAILESGAAALILRTSWVYSLTGQNFLNTMLRLGNERDELRVVNDQWGSPTWTGSLAEATQRILDSTPRDVSVWEYLQQHRGIYHMTNQSYTSWYGFAEAIFKLKPCRAKLLPISSREYVTAARRPNMSRLDNTKLTQTFDITLPDWHDALTSCLRDLP